MIINCPGSKRLKQPHPEMIRCPKCSTEIEIWSDEFEVNCPRCKKTMTRETGQSCIEWCSYARDCVGGYRYARYMDYKSRMKKRERKAKKKR